VDITAREARPHELDGVGELAAAAIEELRPHRGGAIWARREARPAPVGTSLAETWASSDGLVAVGLIDDVMVGYAAIRVETLHDGARLGDLTDLYVEPEARGVGVGEALMVLVETWCRDRSCIGIDSLALPGDRATKNFFESFGLVARALRVHRAL
jgi:GNAT superfamily N-acetyltransferase